MFNSQNKVSGAEGLRSIPSISYEESSWRPSLRKMTKRMFASSSKSPTRPARPTLPQGWMDENTFKPPSPNDPPHTTIPDHPRGPREPPQECLGFIKRSISKRDKEQLPPRQQTHVSKPSIGESSFSVASTEYTQMARENRYPDTDAETSPSSTLPRDLLTPSGNRTSYASKRSGKDYTNSSILLPTVYQPPTNEIIDVSLDSFPAPPFEPYQSNLNLNLSVSSPTSFLSPTRMIHTAPEGKEGPQEIQRMSIAEHPETMTFLSEPQIEDGETQKTTEQLNDDFQVFLAKSRTQAKSRNSMLSQHNFKPDPQPQDIYSTPRTSKILDELTLNHNIKKRLSQTPPLSQSGSTPKPRPLSMRAAPKSRDQLEISPATQPDTQPQITPALQLHPPAISLIPAPTTQPNSQPQTSPQPKEFPKPTQPATPLHESRFSVDSRPHHSSVNPSLYDKMREYMFPRSHPNSTISNSLAITNLPTSQTPRAKKDKSYGTLGTGGGAVKFRRWSRVGRSIKRSLSIDRDMESETCAVSGRGRTGGEF